MTPTDHYAVLGVEKGATQEEIRAAWRAASSKAHPDKGGTADAQAALNEAYRVLADSSLRKQYDSTGRAMPVDIDNAAAQALGGLLEQALQADESEDFGGVLVFMQRAAATAKKKLVRMREDSAALERRFKKAAKRIRRKTPGPNTLADMLLFKATQQRATIVQIDHELKVFARAVQLAGEYEQLPAEEVLRLARPTHYLEGAGVRLSYPGSK